MTKQNMRIKELIHTSNIDHDSQELIVDTVTSLKKQIKRLDFKLKRTLNDKEIAINLLNASIEGLEEKQTLLAEANQQLLQQKKEIEGKNVLLIEQKRLVEQQSEELKNHLYKLKNSYRELEQFSYIASHDLKSPLRSIAGFAQLLKRKYGNQLDDEADEYINFIVKSTIHMGEVIRDLLEYSKMGQSDLTFTPTNLNLIVDKVKEILLGDIEEHHVAFEISHLPTLNVYTTGILQVFQNLISNAIKFRSEEKPFIKVQCCSIENGWKFSVSDNGIGLDEHYQNKVFLPFQRIDGQKIKGTGIGLAICKKIILMHRGDIWYTSQKNKGTTFYFTIKEDK